MKFQTLIVSFFLVIFLGCKKEKISAPLYDFEVKNVYLSNQHEVDSFGIAIEQYNRVKIGIQLNIVGNSIKTLTPLKNKIKFVYHLYIGATSLTTVAGLDSIETVSLVDVINNSDLKEFSIEFSDKRIHMIQIINNDKLKNLNGLKNLEETSRLFIWDNESLKNLEGLESLTDVGEITLRDNDSLYSLDGLESIEGGYMTEQYNIEYAKVNTENNMNLSDHCALTTIALDDKLDFYAYENLYNPTLDDLKQGNCKPD